MICAFYSRTVYRINEWICGFKRVMIVYPAEKGEYEKTSITDICSIFGVDCFLSFLKRFCVSITELSLIVFNWLWCCCSCNQPYYA